ncbi:hypothetical protein EDL81_01215 [Ehrlichia ruminantium]|uniref:hypothetical protein n=1 Tax=Ehrlichia ruminantium TaxID=779 RepID=UPI00130E5191|nr:hypothetical protein [Ehrlichia ruminantium]QGR02300.1 hypothetical protein EDL81_01215 [Ehrlichia ruminantium]
MTTNTKKNFSSFIIALQESYTDNFHHRPKNKFLQQLQYIASSLTNLMYLQFHAESRWIDYPAPLIQTLDAFDNLKILSLTNITTPMLPTYTKTEITLRKNAATNHNTEYLFLNNYLLTTIQYFPRLKFPQISPHPFTANILYNKTQAITLHKYFHSNAITLNTLALSNTTIVNNSAVAVYTCKNKRNKITYDLRNVKVKKDGITNKTHHIEIKTYHNITIEDIPSNNTVIYQFIHSFHFSNYSNITLILLNTPQKLETIKQMIHNIPDYTLINVELHTTTSSPTNKKEHNDHTYHIPVLLTTSKSHTIKPSDTGFPNTNIDTKQTHVNTETQALPSTSSKSLRSNLNITSPPITNIKQSHSNMKTPDNKNSQDSPKSSTTLKPHMISPSSTNPINTHTNTQHQTSEFPNTSKTSHSNFNTTSSPMVDVQASYDEHSYGSSEFPNTPKTPGSSFNITSSPMVDVQALYDEHSYGSSQFLNTPKTPGSSFNITSSPMVDVQASYDEHSYGSSQFLNTPKTPGSSFNITSSPMVDVQALYDEHSYGSPQFPNTPKTPVSNFNITNLLTGDPPIDQLEEDSIIEFYINEIKQNRQIDISLLENYTLKNAHTTHLPVYTETNSCQYESPSSISSDISISSHTMQEYTSTTRIITQGIKPSQVNRTQNNTTNNQKIEKPRVSTISTTLSNIRRTSMLNVIDTTTDQHSPSLTVTTQKNLLSTNNINSKTIQSHTANQPIDPLAEKTTQGSSPNLTSTINTVHTQQTINQLTCIDINSLSIEKLIEMYLDEDYYYQKTDFPEKEEHEPININTVNSPSTSSAHSEKSHKDLPLSPYTTYPIDRSKNATLSTTIHNTNIVHSNTTHTTEEHSSSPSYKIKVSHRKPYKPYNKTTQQSSSR